MKVSDLNWIIFGMAMLGSGMLMRHLIDVLFVTAKTGALLNKWRQEVAKFKLTLKEAELQGLDCSDLKATTRCLEICVAELEQTL